MRDIFTNDKKSRDGETSEINGFTEALQMQPEKDRVLRWGVSAFPEARPVATCLPDPRKVTFMRGLKDRKFSKFTWTSDKEGGLTHSGESLG